MRNLKVTRKANLEEFLKEHEADLVGDLDKLDAVLKRSFQGNGKASLKASSREASDD
jgi:hypothetical protein